MPSLPRLLWLDLSWNSMESFSWMSLRALPVLRTLALNNNRLRYVELGSVLEHLPKLKVVNIRHNKLTSLSQYELGRPQVKETYIMDNPFHCDCDLFWLIEKMACLEACKKGDEKPCCQSCSACFLIITGTMKYNKIVCHSPIELKYLPLSEASAHLQECREQAAPSTTRQGIFHFVWKPTSLQLGSNPTTNTKPHVGQAQTMFTTNLHRTARDITYPYPTQRETDKTVGGLWSPGDPRRPTCWPAVGETHTELTNQSPEYSNDAISVMTYRKVLEETS
ncbi:hypothetical protein Bbelb_156400 [Branchiostoma belcheri]|nr:hypothetical protein Bbelb_156400 [Branchiostoma belcheri]